MTALTVQSASNMSTEDVSLIMSKDDAEILDKIRKGEKDPSNGLPMVKLLDLAKFKLISSEKFNNLKIAESLFSYRGTDFMSKGFYVSDTIKLKLPEVSTHTPLLIEEQSKDLLLCRELDDLIYIYNTRMNNVLNKKMCTSPYKEISPWLSLFSVYGEDFYSYFTKYVANPDKSVELTTKDNSFLSTLSRDLKRPLTENDIKISAHLILICMSTPINTEHQLKKFVKLRLNTMKDILKASSPQLAYDQLLLKNIKTLFNCLPRLKTTLFEFAYCNRLKYAELDIAVKLMTKRCMTSFHLCLSFLSVKYLTLAHSNYQVLYEAGTLLKRIRKIKEEIGNIWPYWRFLRPKDRSIDNCNWPNLIHTAVTYNKKYVKSLKYFKYHEGLVEVGQVEKLCQEKLDRSRYTISENRDTEFQALLREINDAFGGIK
ncbi:uncharacterized protein [Prorops nasuta]|uniref:uncharacterized protein n=1 Tax=Prorops nasuta TaxID=863751 RepID=UPI0034CFF967